MIKPDGILLSLLLALAARSVAADDVRAPRPSGHEESVMHDWQEQRGERDGEAFVIRVLRDLPDRAVQKRHPQRLILGLAYDEEGSRRLPNAAEWRQIDAYARAFRAVAEHAGAIIVASLTSDGFHQYIFYCDDPAKAHVRLMGALADLDQDDEFATIDPIWEITDDPDAGWHYIQQIAAGP